MNTTFAQEVAFEELSLLWRVILFATFGNDCTAVGAGLKFTLLCQNLQLLC